MVQAGQARTHREPALKIDPQNKDKNYITRKKVGFSGFRTHKSRIFTGWSSVDFSVDGVLPIFQWMEFCPIFQWMEFCKETNARKEKVLQKPSSEILAWE